MTAVKIENVENVQTYEEPEDHALRQQLGLRPIAFRVDGERKGTHPGRGECPSWCWISQQDEYDHEIEPAHPLIPTHTTNGSIAIAASQYGGVSERDSDRWVATATISARMEQRGDEAPTIRLGLLHYEAGERLYRDEVLRLSLDDAEDLSTALQHLVKLADS